MPLVFLLIYLVMAVGPDDVITGLVAIKCTLAVGSGMVLNWAMDWLDRKLYRTEERQHAT